MPKQKVEESSFSHHLHSISVRNHFGLMWRGSALLVSLLFVLQLQQSSSTADHSCIPSSCGKISNISHPFRLKNDPEHCGDSRYELTCENNLTVASLYSGKYYVQAINYNNFTIRLVDPGVQQSNCSSIPRYFLSQSNFSDTYNTTEVSLNGYDSDPYQATSDEYWHALLFQHIVYMNCSHPVADPAYVDTSSCVNWHSKGYIYAIVGPLPAKMFQVDCHVKLVAPTSWWGSANMLWNWDDHITIISQFPDSDDNILISNFSYTSIHSALEFGFQVSWVKGVCENHCRAGDYCYFNHTNEKIQCADPDPFSRFCFYFEGTNNGNGGEICGIWSLLQYYVKVTIQGILIGLLEYIEGRKYRNTEYRSVGRKYHNTEYTVGITIGHYVLPSFMAARYVFGVTLLIVLLIYKWRRRHLSMYENIEMYLQENTLMPIRYSYKEIKMMTRGFKDKLGEGGYGCVFKGKLRSGPDVAIKLLGKSKTNGQDFISEVATIGRIHHVHVVQLIGFCVEGSKHALVYEFMPNGSLDKYIFSKEGSIPLSYDKIYDISLGIARGIAYLHQGCDMQILHFDIKPHNILLDENFTPKVSDFGLAKLYPVDSSIVTMTAARGTIGYMAPELFYKNIGGVSYKADVYSYGMLLMEMVGRRRNLNPHTEHSSHLYFPFWIYDQLDKDKDIEMEDLMEEEKEIAKKMAIVALWCIQLKPHDRPSMSRVVEMLEGEVESLEMPPKPSLYPHETITEGQRINSDQTMSSDFISSASDSMEIETSPLIENVS